MAAGNSAPRLVLLIALVVLGSCSAEPAAPPLRPIPEVPPPLATQTAELPPKSEFGGRGDNRNLKAGAYFDLYDAALDYLARTQQADGSWSVDGSPAMTTAVTGLALLPFLGMGESPLRGKHKQAVAKGAAYLLGIQDRDGHFGAGEEPYSAVQQAVATLAMCELYRPHAEARYRESAERGLRHLFKAPGFETSSGFWTLLALRCGRSLGIDLPEGAIDDSASWLDRITNPRSGAVTCTAGELGPHTPASLAAAGVLGRIFVNRADPRRDPLLKLGRARMAEDPSVGDGLPDPANHLFLTFAINTCGGEAWKEWNGRFHHGPVTELQLRDGPLRGSWPPTGVTGRHVSRPGTTALFFMCRLAYICGGGRLFWSR